MLKVKARESVSGNEPMVIEVWKDEELVGQLPAARVTYRNLPQDLGRMRIDLYVEHADLESMS
jgi:hypothetical protein